MMTGPEVLEDPENKQINSWPKCNFMTFDRMMINLWTKWVIDFERGEGQLDKDIGPRSTKYKTCPMNRISLNKYDKISLDECDNVKQ